MKMLALKVGQEMLEICQVSRPITTVQSAVVSHREMVQAL
jgi:hypothetical protein